MNTAGRPQEILAPRPRAASTAPAAESGRKRGPAVNGRVNHPTDRRAVGCAARSALGVLRSLAGLLQAVLLALGDARVAGQEAGLLQGGAVVGVVLAQGPGDR